MAEQTAEHVKAHADVMELEAVDFLDSNGQFTQQQHRVATVRLKFIDGSVFRISKAEWEKLENYSFRLRPAKNDA